MRLVITEKNLAAKKIAELLATGNAKQDKVYDTAVYRFNRNGEEWVSIGLKGHILGVDFVENLSWSKKQGWFSVDDDGVLTSAALPEALPKPPFKKRKPFSEDSVDLRAWKVAALPYLVYAPLRKTPAEKGIIRSVKNLAAKAESVVIATDFDREGELIGSDALSVVREVAPEVPATRARYSAITKEEITHAFENQTTLDVDLAQAGESRQWIDLIWGAVLTRYLTIAKRVGFGNVRPSGRVQTPTLALIVAREEERRAFIPEDYWVIKGTFNARYPLSSAALAAAASANAAGEKNDDPDAFECTHATERFKVEAEAVKAMAALEGADTGRVSLVEKKERKVAPPVPFNTTSLQAAAASEGLSPARTMRIAESLYMDGYISYPRVDNTVYPASLDLAGTVKMLKGVPAYAPYADQLLAQAKTGKLTATRGKTETTDHPPIYPTGVGDPGKLRPEEWKLYNLVARRFMATLSGFATVEGTKVTIEVAGEPFVARGDVLVHQGFRAIYPYGLKRDEQLPLLAEGQDISFLGATLTQKQTEPPARYSQGRLIQEMEKLGLGTKSTRHSIIERLTEVRYIQNDPVEPTALGIAVVDALGRFAPHITTPDMTAQLEEEMSSIAAGKSTRDAVIGHSRKLLAEIMEELIPVKEEVGEALVDAITADARVGACPTCGKSLLLKNSVKTHSNFIGCSGWPECDVTYPVPQGRVEAVEELCAVCGSPQLKITPFRSKPHLQCIDPQCSTNHEPDLIVGSCPVCAAAGRQGDLVAQKSQRTLKRFIRCTNYELCNVSYPLPQRGKLVATGTVCEACGAPKVIVTTARGPWELCPNIECPLREEKEKAKAEKLAARSAGASTGKATKKPAAKKSTVKKSAAKKTTAKKSTAKKPVAKKTTAAKASATKR
ncbi:MAG: DNA topoisomerase I [Coriobacteriales bacterium]|nr:DNA topoisomerase I [Coriobacteriales bacterium]